MKIKSKLTLGIGLLFALIVALAATSTWYINVLKEDTNNILVANYNTLEYSRNMIEALDRIKTDPDAAAIFRTNLDRQMLNETETGEKEATERVADRFDALLAHPGDTAQAPAIRQGISELMRINMEAIRRKSRKASSTAQVATTWIAVAGALCFLIGLVLLINLPGSIANPIEELTESIRQIAAQHYNQRVHFESHSEFGELARSFNTMAEKLEEYAGSNIARLLMEKQRIEALINHMPDPVIGLDERGTVLFANQEALKITGLDAGAFIGANAKEVSEANDLVRRLIKDIQKPETGNSMHPLKIFADGRESYFEKKVIRTAIVPTGESEPQERGQVIILRNVTPFKERDFAKTNFIATISHELKTPISSINMSVRLLEHDETGRLNEAQRQLLESIQEDSSRLLKITGELLDMSQVETGHIQLHRRPSNAYDILQYAIDTTKTQAEQKHVRISLETEDGIEPIHMDSEKTAWVLTNFLTNAIRYSPAYGEIILALRKTPDGVRYAVRDFGKGIEAKYRDRVFERYFKVPGSVKAGTGLGLAISKDFIEAQGGRIGLETEEGLGSTFFFDLP